MYFNEAYYMLHIYRTVNFLEFSWTSVYYENAAAANIGKHNINLYVLLCQALILQNCIYDNRTHHTYI